MTEIKDSLYTAENTRYKKDAKFYIALIVMTTVMLFVNVLFGVVYMSVRVSGDSMKNTLINGDMLYANTVKKDVKRGDIVIIGGLKDKDYIIIKRVIAVGGEKVAIRNGKVFINDEPLSEDYLDDGVITDLRHAPDKVTDENGNLIDNELKKLLPKGLVLEEDEIFYLGDNREVSADARINGPCKKENVIGIVENWSVNVKGITNAIYNFQKKLYGFFGIDLEKNIQG